MENTKILIIEDNYVTLKEIEIHVKNMGYKMTKTAIDSEEAINKAEKFKPDLLLSDINLGGSINGIETVNIIRRKLDVPVIYLTAYDDDDTLMKAHITEPYAYIVKPFQERELSIAISIALYKHKAEKQLKEAIATKNKLISIISHDLRNSLGSIHQIADLLIKNYGKFDDAKTIKIINRIYNSTGATFTLLESLLCWAKNQSEIAFFNPEPCMLHAIVSESVSLLEWVATTKQITIIESVPDDLEVCADSEMMKTLFRNLLSNAIKFTGVKGKITITAEQKETQTVIAVTDNGIGMNDITRQSLFKIGQTQSQLGTCGEKGTGFGLVLCKEIIDKHNGDIRVESEKGKGSAFIFTIPASE